MECASLMPIDLFFEAPRLMDSCNFTDDHTSLTRDVRWYDGTMFDSTLHTYDGSEYYTTLLTKNEELKFVPLSLS